MRSAWKVSALFLVAVAAAGVQAKQTGADVLSLVEKNYKGIKDYKVDVTVSVKSPQLNMPRSVATLYYKEPNKTKIVPKEGFMMLPKDAFPGNPVNAIKAGFNTTLVGSAKFSGSDVYVLKLVPKEQRSQSTMKLYVEKNRGLILGADANNGDAYLKSKWSYTRVDGKYWLPSEIKMEMSGTLSDPAFDPREMKVKAPKSGKGTGNVKFSNYKVNKGIPDKVFSNKK
jgi:outer membrane lipoprotein-sorting protein